MTIALCSSSDFKAKFKVEHIKIIRNDSSFKITTPSRISFTGTNDWVACEVTGISILIITYLSDAKMRIGTNDANVNTTQVKTQKAKFKVQI